MKCPFLRETEVKYCRQSASRKIAVRSSATESERCSSPAYIDCQVFRAGHDDSLAGSACPFLERSLAQFCAAAPVTKLIPYSEAVLSRCGNGGFRYCELFSAYMRAPVGESQETADGLAVPNHLAFTPNHMWLDATGEGGYYIGIDALLAKALGPVDALTFVTTNGVQRPTAVVTVHGTDFQIVFPRPLLIRNANLYLRANPAKLASDPYAAGWLFEVADPPGPANLGDMRNVLRGAAAMNWMRSEVDRVSRFVHETVSRDGFVNDGGQFGPELLRTLEREPSLRLFNEFFSPYREWTR
jgi:glycine cleavage system H lipoate-binding protein